MKEKKKKKSIFQKKQQVDYILNFKTILESKEIKENYSSIILNIIIQMIDNQPKGRPKIEDILIELKEIQNHLRKTRKRALTNKFGSLDQNQKMLLKNHDQVALLYNEMKGPYMTFTYYTQ